MNDMKNLVKAHWEKEVCGSRYATMGNNQAIYFEEMSQERYRLEPYIPAFADFKGAKGKDVLEIGVGGGVDFASWLAAGAKAVGIDLTQVGVELTKRRLETLGFDEDSYRLGVGDAENLTFPDESFDLVYSYGVLHHTPDTGKALSEAHRVLRKKGCFKAMVYHVPSVTGWLLWVRYCFLTGKWFKTPRDAIYEHMESFGTKAYTVSEMRSLLERLEFVNIKVYTKLIFGDLLLNKRSDKYQSPIYGLIWKLYPRWLVRALGDRYGFFLFIEAQKDASV